MASSAGVGVGVGPTSAAAARSNPVAARTLSTLCPGWYEARYIAHVAASKRKTPSVVTTAAGPPPGKAWAGRFAVAGRAGIANIKGQLVNMRDGGFASAHDFHISALIAEVLCGGDVDAGSLVSEDYLMALERERFCALLEHPKTQERIMGMLQTGKPVRN